MTNFDDLPLIKHHDAVHVADSAQAMGDHDARARDSGEIRDNRLLADCIEVTRRLVE
jgi:hypothetical protein